MKLAKIFSSVAVIAAVALITSCYNDHNPDKVSDATKTGTSVSSGGYAIEFGSGVAGNKPLTEVSASSHNLAISSSGNLALATTNDTLGQGAFPFVMANPNYDPNATPGLGTTNFKTVIEAVVSCGGTKESGRLVAFTRLVKTTILSTTGLTSVVAAGGGMECNSGVVFFTAFADMDNDGFIDAPNSINGDGYYSGNLFSGIAGQTVAQVDTDCTGGFDRTASLTVLSFASAGDCDTGTTAALNIKESVAAAHASFYKPIGTIASFSESTEYTLKITLEYVASTGSMTADYTVDGTTLGSQNTMTAADANPPTIDGSTSKPINVLLGGNAVSGNGFTVAMARATTTTSPYIKSVTISKE